VNDMTPSDSPATYNVEAEQQLLGAILTNNDTLPVVDLIIGPEDFYEPTHGRLYAAMREKIGRTELVSPITMKAIMAEDPGLAELGGPGYLARLAGAAISGFAAKDYAELIRETSAKRDALEVLRSATRALQGGKEAVGDVLGGLEAALTGMAPSRTGAQPMSFLAATTAAIMQINDVYQGNALPSVPMPWGPLADIVPSVRPGDMCVIGGRPSMGKSAVALSIATHAARMGHPVVFACFEMTPEDMAMRALSEASSLANNAVAYTSMVRDLREDQFRTVVDQAKEMQVLPIQLLSVDFARPGSLISGVRKALRTMNMKNGKTPLIVVDYLQLMDAEGRSKVEKITEISLQVKRLAVKENAGVIALSQLSRKCEERDDKRPMLSDLRESGQIEQDADTVIFCYRDEYYAEREKPQGRDDAKLEEWVKRIDRAHNRIELIVAKQRRGPIGTAGLNCALKFNRIWE